MDFGADDDRFSRSFLNKRVKREGFFSVLTPAGRVLLWVLLGVFTCVAARVVVCAGLCVSVRDATCDAVRDAVCVAVCVAVRVAV
jgi:hypothetical protein